jgi:hypothetical protein
MHLADTPQKKSLNFARFLAPNGHFFLNNAHFMAKNASFSPMWRAQRGSCGDSF